ncbi:MAG: diversity-generating retroelement protein Avd [Blastocatellia bacterium]
MKQKSTTPEMTILTKTFDLLDWLLPRLETFPKPYRLTLTLRLANSSLNFQELIFDAMSVGGRTRQRHLRLADAELNKVRLYLRLVHRRKWINDGQYRHASSMVAEIGRMLGGWIKSPLRDEEV